MLFIHSAKIIQKQRSHYHTQISTHPHLSEFSSPSLVPAKEIWYRLHKSVYRLVPSQECLPSTGYVMKHKTSWHVRNRLFMARNPKYLPGRYRLHDSGTKILHCHAWSMRLLASAVCTGSVIRDKEDSSHAWSMRLLVQH